VCHYSENTRQHCVAACLTERKFFTFIECISADKVVILPHTNVLGAGIMEPWIIINGLPDNDTQVALDTGYSNDDSSCKEPKHFEQHSAQ
jgi:hypothetical protein